jgi:hypothetical protein
LLHKAFGFIIGCACVFLLGHPAWAQGTLTREQLMKDARMAAATGNEYSLRVPGKDPAVYVFYNNTDPFCFFYAIPGEWVYGEEPGSWLSKDGKKFVGVLPYQPQDFGREKGNTLVEKAAALFTKDFERKLKQKLTGTTLTPFEAATERTWKLSFPPVNQRGREAYPAAKYLVEVGPEGLLVLTVGVAKTEEDEFARRILSTMKTSTTAPCFLPQLDEVFGIITGASPPATPAVAKPPR